MSLTAQVPLTTAMLMVCARLFCGKKKKAKQLDKKEDKEVAISKKKPKVVTRVAEDNVLEVLGSVKMCKNVRQGGAARIIVAAWAPHGVLASLTLLHVHEI